jgi:hypothetical protein
MVEGFGLPDLAPAIQSLVNPVSRGPFDGLQNFSQAKVIPLAIGQGGEYQVDVIWHHDDAVNLRLKFMIMQAMLKHQTSEVFGDLPPIMGEKVTNTGLSST